MNKLKKIFFNNAFLRKILNFLSFNSIDKGISFDNKGIIRKSIVKQKKKNNNNVLVVDAESYLSNVIIRFFGSNNTIRIGRNTCIKDSQILVFDNNNSILIGNNTNLNEKVKIVVLEGGNISIGDHCLISYDVEIRNGDSHSLLMEGQRINYCKNVQICNHVWIGERSLVLKGAQINDNCVVGASSIVTSHIFPSHTLIVGCPAKVVKNNIDWDHQRL